MDPIPNTLAGPRTKSKAPTRKRPTALFTTGVHDRILLVSQTLVPKAGVDLNQNIQEPNQIPNMVLSVGNLLDRSQIQVDS
jgi:hypothetical protein